MCPLYFYTGAPNHENRTQKKQTKINLAIQLNITILITFSVLILWGIFLVRDKLMQNSQELGTYLAQRLRRRGGKPHVHVQAADESGLRIL